MSTEKAHIKTPRRRRRRAGLWGLLAVVMLAVAVPLLLISVINMSVTAPEWVRSRIEDGLNERAGGGRISLDQVRLILEAGAAPRVQMQNVGIYDPNGAEIARLNEVSAGLSPVDWLHGRTGLSGLTVSGAQITVRRRADGTFDLSLGAGAGASGNLAGMMDALDRAFSTPPLSDLTEVTADQLTIALEDSRSGRLLQVTDGTITLSQSDSAVDLTLSAEVFNGTEDLAKAVIGFHTEKGSAKASLTATFENAAAVDIAAQSPALTFLQVLDAPISGALHATIDEKGALEGFDGTLEVGTGALRPDANAQPIRFNGGRAYVAYDPVAQSLKVSGVTVKSEAANVAGEGTAYLEDFNDGWPSTLVGQLSLAEVALQPADMFAEPMRFSSGAVDFRLRLNPFSVDIGQVSLQDEDRRFHGSGVVKSEADGWTVSLDMGLDLIPIDRLLALWPVSVAAGTRAWLEENVISGQISNLKTAFRMAPGSDPLLSMTYQFSHADVRAVRSLPPIRDGAGYASLVGKTFTTVIETGHVDAPLGGALDMSGSVLSIADVTVKQGRVEIAMKTSGNITAGLALLDMPPFRLMSKSGLVPDLAQGHAVLQAAVGFDLKRVVEFQDIDYLVTGRLIDVSSDKLVKDRVVSADGLDLRATPAGVSISGPGRLGRLPADVTWSQAFGPDTAGTSHIEGTVELSQIFLDEFNIGLPAGSVTGKGLGQVSIDFAKGKPPAFSLVSDLNRVGLRISALGWSKARNQTGSLEVSGRLGDAPAIDRISLNAAGLRATGVIDLTPNGGLDTAQFDRVRLGSWLDGPVELRGRGSGRSPAVIMSGGKIDLRAASLGSQANQTGTHGGGGPIDLLLDRLLVSEGITLTEFSGQFTNKAGLAGRFSARVNGGASVNGTLVPTPSGSAVRLLSEDAGGVFASAGILSNARGGKMDLTLNPTGGNGIYEGRLFVKNSRIVGAPALTELISALSIIGLIEQMNSGGISMSEVQAEFQLTPRQVTLYRSSAVGPSLGISLDGTYDLKRGWMNMQGVISPVYFLNGVGQIFSRRGEGLFGFNFQLTGSSSSPDVSVNPLSILTPGMFREIFRRAPPTSSPGQ